MPLYHKGIAGPLETTRVGSVARERNDAKHGWKTKRSDSNWTNFGVAYLSLNAENPLAVSRLVCRARWRPPLAIDAALLDKVCALEFVKPRADGEIIVDGSCFSGIGPPAEASDENGCTRRKAIEKNDVLRSHGALKLNGRGSASADQARGSSMRFEASHWLSRPPKSLEVLYSSPRGLPS